MLTKAIYPGTFDPITHGHEDLIRRASPMFHKIILAIADNTPKNPMFSLNERIGFAKSVVRELDNVEVIGFKGLLTNFARQQKSSICLRSLRSFSDFEHECQLANMNQYLAPALESIFLIPSKKWAFISSSLIKELAYHGGDITPFVSESVRQALLKKLPTY